MSQLGFLVNTDRCVACRSCVIACKDKHDLKPGRKFRKLTSCSAGNMEVFDPSITFSYALSMSCNHCAEPACLKNCPSGAIGKREDGIVFIDRYACIGCGTCQGACPYNAPSLDKVALKMEKCDFCRELIEAGDTPACVAACSMNALEYNDIDILRTKYPMAVQQIAPMKGPETTNPSILVVPHRKYTQGMEVLISCQPEELLPND